MMAGWIAGSSAAVILVRWGIRRFGGGSFLTLAVRPELGGGMLCIAMLSLHDGAVLVQSSSFRCFFSLFFFCAGTYVWGVST